MDLSSVRQFGRGESGRGLFRAAWHEGRPRWRGFDDQVGVRIQDYEQHEGIAMKKTVTFNKEGIGKLPEAKPVMYRIETNNGRDNYVGVAKRGRVQERIGEHLAGAKDPIPGAKVQIEQLPTIHRAEQKEKAVIARSQPKYNKTHK